MGYTQIGHMGFKQIGHVGFREIDHVVFKQIGHATQSGTLDSSRSGTSDSGCQILTNWARGIQAHRVRQIPAAVIQERLVLVLSIAEEKFAEVKSAMFEARS